MFHDDDTLDYLENYNKNTNTKTKNYQHNGTIYTNEKNKEIIDIKLIISVFIIILTIFIYLANANKNPIIGKWRSITPTIIGNIEIEFTNKRMYALGLTSEIKYEEDEDKIIIYDKNKIFKDIGMVFTIKDKYTIENDSFGIKTIYKKIE